jgi:glycosyltransferase involved in cell wall biosynthesis
MNVLHIDTGREMRGGQFQMRLLVAGLRREDVTQTVLANAAHAVPGAMPASWISVRQHARQADIIHAHDARAHTLAVIHGRGKPVVVSRRVAFAIKTGLLSKWKYRRAARFIAVSRHVAHQLFEAGIAPAKFSVVYDAVEPTAEIRPESRKSPRFRVLTHGLADPQKGGRLVAAAARQTGVDLMFATNLPSDLLVADAFVYLSESEGLGSAILLAMVSGVPVIASRTGGIPELIDDNQTGLLVENDVTSVSTAIRRLEADPQLRRRLASAASSRVREEFSDTRMVRETLEIYRQVLRSPPQP